MKNEERIKERLHKHPPDVMAEFDAAPDAVPDAVPALGLALGLAPAHNGESKKAGTSKGGKNSSAQALARLQNEAALAEAQREHAASSAAAVRESLAAWGATEAELTVAAALGESVANAEAEAVRACEERAVAIDGAFLAIEAGAGAGAGAGGKGKGGKGGKAGRSRAARKEGIASLGVGAATSILRNASIRFLKHAPALAAALGEADKLDAVLLCAVRDDNADVVRAALLDPATRIRMQTLESAVSLGKCKALRALLSDPRGQDDREAERPSGVEGGHDLLPVAYRLLSVAVKRGRAGAVKVMLELGVPGLDDAVVHSLTQRALASGRVAVVRALMASEHFDFGAALRIALRVGSLGGVRTLLKDAHFVGTNIDSSVVGSFSFDSSVSRVTTLRAVAVVISDARFSAATPEATVLLGGACNMLWRGDDMTGVVRALLGNPRVVFTLQSLRTAVKLVCVRLVPGRFSLGWHIGGFYDVVSCQHSPSFVLVELLKACSKRLKALPSSAERRLLASGLLQSVSALVVPASSAPPGVVAHLCGECFARMARAGKEVANACALLDADRFGF